MVTRIVNTKGVTLVEVMGSVLVFMIGISALMGVYLQSITASKRAENAYTAYNLAKNRLESLKYLSFGDLVSATETSTVINKDGVPDISGAYSRSTAVTINYTGDSSLTQVTVSISYAISGVQSSVPIQMTTVFFNGG